MPTRPDEPSKECLSSKTLRALQTTPTLQALANMTTLRADTLAATSCSRQKVNPKEDDAQLG